MTDSNHNDLLGLIVENGIMYRKDGHVFGPVTEAEVERMIYAGELRADDEFSSGDGNWAALGANPEWSAHLAGAERKIKAAKAQAERLAHESHLAMLRWIKLGSMGVAAVAVIVSAALLTAKYRPWELITGEVPADRVELRGASMDEWNDRHPPLVSLGLRKQVKEDDKKRETSAAAAAAKKDRKQKASDTGTKVAANDEPKDGLKTEGSELSDADVFKIIQKNISTLFVCLREELKRTPDLRGQLELEFIIDNSGRVAGASIDDSRFREGPLHTCFLEKLGGWKFPQFSGERRVVKYPFFIGKK
ncbi:MAG: AgmX/PglI C-terminal domain-containing protein [Myxococcota bacterium]